MQRFSVSIPCREKLIARLNTDAALNNNLSDFDNTTGDSKKSRYIGWFETEGDYFIFFIREYRRSMIRSIDAAIFDTDCEWIILQVISTLDQVRVSYQSNIRIKQFVPVVIGQTNLEGFKDEDELEEYKVFNLLENVKYFLNNCLVSDSSPLIEIKLEPAPIRGGPVLTIADREEKSLRNEFLWFRQKSADLLHNIELVTECKIRFRNYKVRLIFYHETEGTEIRYSDNSLPLEYKPSFEEFMNNRFSLRVIPGVRS